MGGQRIGVTSLQGMPKGDNGVRQAALMYQMNDGLVAPKLRTKRMTPGSARGWPNVNVNASVPASRNSISS
jgi:hypothetical protein